MELHPLHPSSLVREHQAFRDQFNVETKCLDIEDHLENHNFQLPSLDVRQEVKMKPNPEACTGKILQVERQIPKDLKSPDAPRLYKMPASHKMTPELQLSDFTGSIRQVADQDRPRRPPPLFRSRSEGGATLEMGWEARRTSLRSEDFISIEFNEENPHGRIARRAGEGAGQEATRNSPSRHPEGRGSDEQCCCSCHKCCIL